MVGQAGVEVRVIRFPSLHFWLVAPPAISIIAAEWATPGAPRGARSGGGSR